MASVREENEFRLRVVEPGFTACFAGARLLVARIGKSHSTGDFHETDGAIYAITYTG